MILLHVLKTLWAMLEPRRRLIFIALVMLLIVGGAFEMGGMVVIFAFIGGLAVDAETGHRSGKLGRAFELIAHRPLSDAEFALYGGGLVLTVIAVKNTQSLFVRYHVTRFLSNLSHRVALQLYVALMSLPYEQVMGQGPDTLRERLVKTLDVQDEVFRAATQVLADLAIVTMVFAALFYIHPSLTLVALLAFCLIGVAIYRTIQRVLRQMGRDEGTSSKRVNASLNDSFGGLVETRLRDAVPYFLHRYREALGRLQRIDRKRRAIQRVPYAANELLLTSAIIGSVGFLIMSGHDLNDALPILGVFGFAGLRTSGAISRINASYQTLRQKFEDFQRRHTELIRIAPKVLGRDEVSLETYHADEEPLPEGRDGKLHRRLSLKDVTFRYPEHEDDAVRDINITIKRGQFVSFCGESGSGKTTLLMLVMGLIKPTSGAVLCDDWDIQKHIRSWHHNIGYVGQTAYISPGTVRENVAFGIPPEQVSSKAVWKALELAAAKEFVSALPKKLNARLRSGGGGLSGGERQRIVIARALFHNPSVVIFDEATAALDTVTEAEITRAAVRLRKKKTVICVAHRLSTIKDSDVIHVLEHGRIVASGTYDELLTTSPAFQRLAGVASPNAEAS
jgi:ABC-type multidrug transport system fused ATPase/permease subunit